MLDALRPTLLVLFVAMSACGCAHGVGSPTSGKENAVIKEAQSSENPKLSANEISEKFIVLISEITSQNDLTLKRIQDSTGISLLESENNKYFGFSQKLGDGWFYALWYYPSAAGKKNGIRLDFQNDSDRFADMRAVCSIDFEKFHNALKAIGYRGVLINGELGQPQEWRYYKDDIAIAIIPEFKADPKNGEVFPACVKSIGTLN